MFYATLRDNRTGEETGRLFTAWSDYHRETFGPYVEAVALVPFKVTGRTYADRKAAARDLAITLQHEERPGLTWSDCAVICDYLETIGTRYHLLREFRENGII